MTFDEWYEQEETILQNDIEVYDLETAWNAAINEVVKTAKDGNLDDFEVRELIKEMSHE